MSEDRSSQGPLKPDHSLPRSKILRGRKNFQRLFEASTVMKSGDVQFRYRVYKDPAEGCLIGFAAPKKKIAKAVQRNRVKRLLREAYRTRQSYLQDLFAEYNIGFHGLFLAHRADLTFRDTEREVNALLAETRKRLSNQLKSRSSFSSGNQPSQNQEPPQTDK